MERRSLYSVILAGGVGTRLWPLSRELWPKQFISFKGESSLLQDTVQRVLPFSAADKVLTVTNAKHQFMVRDQLMPLGDTLLGGILVEPCGRNTLPAIAWSTASIAVKDAEAVIAVFPSDHVIKDEAKFRASLESAVSAAGSGSIVTLGIRPNYPATGYGYIKTRSSSNGEGCSYEVESFTEKPDAQTAQSYLKNGQYYWNAGIFVFHASTFQEQLESYQPELFEQINELMVAQHRGDTEAMSTIYGAMSNVSIDYGIMEKTERAAVVPTDFGWSDLGTWDSLYDYLDKDDDSNAVKGNVCSLDTKDSLLCSDRGILTTIGLENVVVVQSGDALLVGRRDRVQDVKKIVQILKQTNGSYVQSHCTVHKPWGSYTVLEEGIGYKVKRLTINGGEKLSLQLHEHRAEHWVVVEGTAKIIIGEKEFTLRPDRSAFVPAGTKHQLENTTQERLQVIEVQTGAYLGEDDIIRFEDRYGRT